MAIARRVLSVSTKRTKRSGLSPSRCLCPGVAGTNHRGNPQAVAGDSRPPAYPSHRVARRCHSIEGAADARARPATADKKTADETSVGTLLVVTCSPSLKGRGFSGNACGNLLRSRLKGLPGPKRTVQTRRRYCNQSSRHRLAPRPRYVRACTHGNDFPWNAANTIQLARCKVSYQPFSHKQAKPARGAGHSSPCRKAGALWPQEMVEHATSVPGQRLLLLISRLFPKPSSRIVPSKP
jgi:hypothetical protein